ncbi:1,4-dihydroxy-2-naphthoate octaprenyltransferase [Neolewinella maritima]|uniref:1,4-dihydroxy-2-naphthoate octaprenyltransferase n=1 Tax=Neolewinella maritima TaxID=1383882 RepID=A0ABM9AYE0_9BACT|nr:UbiA family prenyltransferase [Neolewinella maritima]CAH0999659.1 1,4-dihydroxy-2-naphthoate octaprenyltransferase [Neolewinella maritima]
MPSLPLIDFIRLIRLQNLLVVALTQVLVYYRIILPALDAEGIAGVLRPWKFFELCLVTLAITASGYLVNDLRDVRIDAINHPGKNMVLKMGRSNVQWLFGAIVFVGYLFALLLALRLGERQLLFIFPLAIGMLALYSATLKKIPFLGNFLVALYCAGVPGILVVTERRALATLLEVNPALGTDTLRVCVLFMAFALVATLLRELVKDLEDLRGDQQEGRRTLPVLLGVTTSRRLAIMLGVMVVVSILSPVFLGWPAFMQPPMLICIGLLLVIVLIILGQLARARQQVDYHKLSLQIKILLVGGLGLLIVF